MKFTLQNIMSLIGKSIQDRDVVDFFDGELDQIERDEYYGSLEYYPEGVDIVFQEAWHVIPGRSDGELILQSAHLHAEGHEKFSEYTGKLPKNIEFGDEYEVVLSKVRTIKKMGGNLFSSLVGEMIGKWITFEFDKIDVHCQFDLNGALIMVTIMMPQ